MKPRKPQANRVSKGGTIGTKIPQSQQKRVEALGWVSTVDSEGRTIWIVDAHGGDGKRFVVRADEVLSAFLELESAIRACGDCA
jgi:hypothetical protein